MTVSIPTLWTVGRRVYSETGRDAHGNPRPSWAAPVPVPVHAVGPRLATEPDESGRWPVIDGLTVYAPAGTVVGAHDRVVWPFTVDAAGAVVEAGDEYTVEGGVMDWTRGPFSNPVAGVTFDMLKVTG